METPAESLRRGYSRAVPAPSEADLTSEQRSALAQLAVAAQEWVFGHRRSRSRTDAVAALREISTDPVVLGIALGRALANVELDGMRAYQRLAELYRTAGADEQVAAADLQRQRTLYWASTRRR
jgi:hypothetical protein